MKILFEEISIRFPEIQSKIFQEDEDSPYLLMNHLAHWLKRLSKDEVTPEIGARIKSFVEWCENQPRGTDAGDDLLTILVVGFYEELFKLPDTRSFLPILISKEDIVRNAEYFRDWVGDENYELALKEYK